MSSRTRRRCAQSQLPKIMTDAAVMLSADERRHCEP
jgi:hypothetical protein